MLMLLCKDVEKVYRTLKKVGVTFDFICSDFCNSRHLEGVNVTALDETTLQNEKDEFVIQNEKPDNYFESNEEADSNEREGTKETFEFQIRFLSLTDPNALAANSNLNITILPDPENKILVISDSGVGMTKKQLKENLGTIAKSGTSEFLSAIEDDKADVNLIGQFGVGFYSAFLVADKVIVTTKHNDDDQYIWESKAVNDFTIYKDPSGNTLGRGTQIKLYLKEDSLSFLEEGVIRDLIAKYSEFINFPIWLWTKKTEIVEADETEVDETVDDSEKNKDSDEPDIEDITEDSKKEKKTKTVEVPGWELMNTQKPLWTRDSKNVTDLEYENFYLSFFKESNPPLAWTHYKGEGDVEFKAIIYIPSKAPDNLFQKIQDYARNVKLFVKRVFITDEFLDFVPKYLAFIKAIVDADDLPLNVSRETLQQHKILQLIKKHIIKKTLDMISNLSKDDEKYEKFLKEFGVSLKVGAIEDDNNRKKIAQLLRFPTSNKELNWTSLDGYISRMKKNQQDIYFLAGSSVEEIEKSPLLEGFKVWGFEVLYMIDPIDEMLVQRMPGHGGKIFKNIAKDVDVNVDLEKMSKLKFKFLKLTNWIQTILSDYVEKVKISDRLTTSPCAVVANQWVEHSTKINIIAQVLKQENEFLKDFYAKQKRIFEINPNHPLILGLLENVENDKADDNAKEMVEVLYSTALIRSGYELDNKLDFATKIEKILRANLGVDLNAEAVVDISPIVDDDKDEEKKPVDLFDELDDSTDPTKPK
ncbi:10864_t:CDS:2 [Acaulospora colombiana]|uniref:10864_t:CDS:1 n=1 Tax=Acaulospora colombiana TaxID=27376 RepID=A0ACA9LK89_9GLOM|nr:10864_t:CDS:2 [Acaulospora colombiana]